MAVAAMDAPRTEPVRIDASRIGALILMRLAIGDGGAAEHELTRDLQPLVAPVIETGAWRLLVGRLIGAHVRDQLVEKRGGRLQATAAGRRQAERFIGTSLAASEDAADDWISARDGLLVAKALGTPALPPRRLKALGKADGLACAIVAAAYGLRLRSTPSAAKLRNALALLALDRAFGNRLQRDLGAKSGLSAKAGRILAGQLSARPRDFGTDNRLVAGLAAEAVGSTGASLAALRAALLRGFVTGTLDWPLTPGAAAGGAPAAAKAPSGRMSPPIALAPVTAPPRPAAVERPTPAAFANAVRSLARRDAVGWSGSRKVFISQLWTALREQHAGWGLSEIEFKAMLTEAHRTGLLALGTSDLRDKRDSEAIQASATVFKNTVWHYVRVDDE